MAYIEYCEEPESRYIPETSLEIQRIVFVKKEQTFFENLRFAFYFHFHLELFFLQKCNSCQEKKLLHKAFQGLL